MDLIQVNTVDTHAVTIRVRGHQIQADRHPDEGGTGVGPTPVELFTASLGSCIAIMVNEYCRNHGYSDGAVSVSLTTQMGGTPKRIQTITVDLEIPADVPPEKREALYRVARACPIHHTLENPPQIDLEIV